MQTGLAAGTTVGGLTVEAVLGTGASGTVYRARDGAGVPLALKVLDPALAADRRFRERFLREAALAGTLEHPSVVPIIATGEDAGLLYIAMAYVDGVDLRTLLRDQGPLPPDRALSLLEGIAGALDAAHAAGLVHRDVTPGNVLVGRVDGQEGTYLADFGLARQAGRRRGLPGERSFVGTIDYIAPEQIRGDPLDGSADQYALACVLYASLTGSPPFVRETDVATVFAHLNERPPPASSRVPDLPPRLDAVLARGLAKEPAGRYADCRALLAAAEAALRGPPAAGRRVRTAVLAAAAAVVLGLVAAAAAVAVLAGDDPVGATLALTSPTPGLPDAAAPADVETAAQDAAPATTATDGARAAEALRLDAGSVALIDVAARRVVAQVPLPDAVSDLAVAGGAPWTGRASTCRSCRAGWPRRVPRCG